MFPLSFTGSLDNVCIDSLDNMLKQLPVIMCNASSNSLSAKVSTQVWNPFLSLLPEQHLR